MPKWNVSIDDETDRAVRRFLARSGTKKGDLSTFVEDAVKREMLRRSIEELRDKDPSLTEGEAEELAASLAALERGVEDVHADRGESMKDALRRIADELGLTLGR